MAELEPPKSRISSELRTKRGSRVSLAPATDQSVVSYYHSNHAIDPPTISSRKSARLSMAAAQQRDTFVSIYKPEPVPGDTEEGGGRQYMFEYGKDNPAPKKEEQPSFFQRWKKSILHHLLAYKVLFFIQVCCGIYIACRTLAPIPIGLRTRGGLLVDFVPLPSEEASQRRTDRGYLWDGHNLRAIICSNKLQLVFIGLSRISAYSMYPCLVMVYITKFRSTMLFLSHTPLTMFTLNAVDLHELHVHCGWYIFVDCSIHTLMHCARWANQGPGLGNMYLLFNHPTGVTGFVVYLATLLIIVPMTFWRLKIVYEIRKNIHYLFIIFGLAMTWHAPAYGQMNAQNGGFCAYIFPALLGWWALDWFIAWNFLTEKIETTEFEVLPNGVQITMAVSERFHNNGKQGGYGYVCLPFVDKWEWHAFSLFENPTAPNERQMFMQRGGDWTFKVHRLLERETVRPAWIQGPYPSPYNQAEQYDHQVLVASGIGITPALSVIRAHKDTRQINLIWSVRDRHLLEFFLRHLYLDHTGWNLIFYTGKEPLPEDSVEIFTNSNICIILGRPRLRQLIPSIIYGIESGQGNPEDYVPEVTQDAELREDLGDYLDVDDDGSKVDIDEKALEAQIEANLTAPDDAGADGGTGVDRIDFKPWNAHPESHEYVKQLDPDEVLSSWAMMYCGGAVAVLEDLEAISHIYGINVHIESFGW